MGRKARGDGMAGSSGDGLPPPLPPPDGCGPQPPPGDEGWPRYSASVDIDEFYDADERRRRSPEVELGTEWVDKEGVRYELNWVQDTGELYVMREPAPHEYADPFGGIHINIKDSAPADGMTVGVIGRVDSRDELERVMAGWLDAMGQPDSTAWIVERLRAAGESVPSENAPDAAETAADPSEGPAAG